MPLPAWPTAAVAFAAATDTPRTRALAETLCLAFDTEIDEEAYQQAVDVLRVSGAGVEPEPALSEQERTEYKTGP